MTAYQIIQILTVPIAQLHQITFRRWESLHAEWLYLISTRYFTRPLIQMSSNNIRGKDFCGDNIYWTNCIVGKTWGR